MELNGKWASSPVDGVSVWAFRKMKFSPRNRRVTLRIEASERKRLVAHQTDYLFHQTDY